MDLLCLILLLCIFGCCFTTGFPTFESDNVCGQPCDSTKDYCNKGTEKCESCSSLCDFTDTQNLCKKECTEYLVHEAQKTTEKQKTASSPVNSPVAVIWHGVYDKQQYYNITFILMLAFLIVLVLGKMIYNPLKKKVKELIKERRKPHQPVQIPLLQLDQTQGGKKTTEAAVDSVETDSHPKPPEQAVESERNPSLCTEPHNKHELLDRITGTDSPVTFVKEPSRTVPETSLGVLAAN